MTIPSTNIQLLLRYKHPKYNRKTVCFISWETDYIASLFAILYFELYSFEIKYINYGHISKVNTIDTLQST